MLAQTIDRTLVADARRTELSESLTRLQHKGLVTGDGESLSLRIPGRDLFIYAAPVGQARSGRTFTQETRLYDFSGQLALNEPPPRADAAEFAGIHAAVYRARPDVGAILWNRQPWGAALHAASAPMPTIFDEQARQMGPSVERLPADAFAGGADAGARALAGGANAFLFRGGVLLLGMTRERVVFTAELLEKCARAYLLALAAGEPVGRIPLYVRVIAHRRLLKDERRSAACYARGEIPSGFTAY